MSDYRQQQDNEQEALELLGALNRVTLGLGGRAEANILAAALGLDNWTNRRNGDTDE